MIFVGDNVIVVQDEVITASVIGMMNQFRYSQKQEYNQQSNRPSELFYKR